MIGALAVDDDKIANIVARRKASIAKATSEETAKQHLDEARGQRRQLAQERWPAAFNAIQFAVQAVNERLGSSDLRLELTPTENQDGSKLAQYYVLLVEGDGRPGRGAKKLALNVGFDGRIAPVFIPGHILGQPAPIDFIEATVSEYEKLIVAFLDAVVK